MTKEERCRAAKAYREKGLNCAQCLLATFRDVAGLTEQQALGLGSGLGGGVRCGGICGAVSAPVLILGASCPDPSDRPHTTKQAAGRSAGDWWFFVFTQKSINVTIWI